jgi:hypothetical protein
MILTIHQPNFFPWYPFFQKISQADKFVFLNNSQFQKNYLQNRFLYQEKWHTLSVNKGLDPIITKKYINYKKDWSIIKNKLPEFYDVLSIFDDVISENLVDTNMKIISIICKMLDIKTELLLDYKTNLTATERIIDICLHYKANTYLSGISGKNYLDLSEFKSKNIEVIFQDESKMHKKPIIEILKEKIIKNV